MKSILKIVGVIPLLVILYSSAIIVCNESSMTSIPLASIALFGSATLVVLKMINFEN